LFRKKGRKDEIDLAAETVFQILKTGAENVETEEQTEKEEKIIEEPQLEKHESEEITKEKTTILPSDDVLKLLNPIDRDLEKIEDTLEKINPKIESIFKLLPTLNSLKELQQHNIAENTKEMEKKHAFLQKLKKQEEDINQELQKKQQIKENLDKDINQMENVLTQVRDKIPELTAEKERFEIDLTQREENLRMVEEHIRRILKLQKASSTPITEAS
jgi:chromosome segregation ATPase